MINKKVSVLFLLLFVCSVVFAASYTISGYKFEIKGNTKEETVRELIVPNYVETFESEETLKQALEEKKHILINTRIFFEDEIFYHYDIEPSGGGNNKVYLTYATTDAKSKLILPYPKYDSNTGLMLGLRYKDKNFMGLYRDFSINVDTKQYESSYKEGDFYVEIPFECIKIGNIEFSGQFESELDLHDSSNDYVLFDIKEEGLRFGDIGVRASAVVDFNYYNSDFRKLGYGISVGKIKFGDSGAYADLSSGMLLNWKDKSDTYLDGKMILNDIFIKNTCFKNISYIKMKAEDETNLDKGLKIYQLEDSFRLNLNTNTNKFSLGTRFTHFNDYDKEGDLFETLSDFSYRHSDRWLFSLLFETKRHTTGGLTDLIPGERVTFYSKLFEKIPLELSLSEHNDFKVNDDTVQAYFGTAVSSEYDKIDYVENFRIGRRFKVNADFEYHPWEDDIEKKSKYKFNVDYTSFPFALSWLNPSVRIKLIASTKETYWEDDSSWRLDKDDLQQLFRGIRTDNEYIKRAYDSSKLVSAMNLNIMTNMFEFEDFGKTYFNFFVDTGIIRAKNIDRINGRDYKVLTGAGLEAIAIMDSHPAYPIRASLGFNMEKFYDKFVDDNDDAELEYEVYIGLGFVY